MSKPSAIEIAGGGYTSVSRSSVKSRLGADLDRTVEVFRRDSDGTHWRIDSHSGEVSPYVMQVEPKMRGESIVGFTEVKDPAP